VIGCARGVVHEKRRAALGGQVDAPEILSDEAEQDELHAEQERRHADVRRPPRDSVPPRGLDQDIGQLEEGQEGGREAQHGADPERGEGEGGHAGHGEPEHLAQRVLGLAGQTRRRMEGHGHTPESGPGDQSAEEVFPFLELEQVVHDAAVDQSEISGARRHRYSRQGREDPIEHRGGRALERPDVHGILAVGEHDERARLPLSHQLRDQRRRVLQIGVHGHDRPARGVLESGQNGRLLTEAPRQTDSVDSPVVARDSADGRPGPVGASVIDEHELVLPLRRAEVGADGVVQRIEIGLLVVAGRNDGDERPAAIRHHLRLPGREVSPRAGDGDAGAASAGRFVAARRDESVAPEVPNIPCCEPADTLLPRSSDHTNGNVSPGY